MQTLIKNLLKQALDRVLTEQNLTLENLVDIQVERCRDSQHGDFASNFAMILAKSAKLPPRQLAELLLAALPASPLIAYVAVAGPGFINFTLTDAAYHALLRQILREKTKFGRDTLYQGKRVYLEFVSANPTGPLHVGHGRSAAYATCVGNLLEAVGYTVHREYYVNDAGRQMRILALSTWLRYLQQLKETVAFPQNAYQGDYIIEIANKIYANEGKQYYHVSSEILAALAQHHYDEQEQEAAIDTYIAVAQRLLGEANFAKIQLITMQTILEDICQDLSEFGVEFDEWFHESKLMDLGLLTQGIELLRAHGHVYERDGATWFCATHFGDEKDRVLVRENGQPTYFASDVAYHLHKYNQDYDKIIDVFGADHHGYIARIRAFLQGLGKNPDKLTVLLVQFVSLFRGQEKISMSTRSGSFVTLRELRQEVGNDSARFFYVFRKPEQHLDFDLELAKRQSIDNPVYYLQYAHARICSVWRQLDSSEWQWQQEQGEANLNLLVKSHEKELLRQLARFPENVRLAADQYAPHLLAHYLYELAHLFHSYYNSERFLIEDSALRNARLCLIGAVQQVIANALNLLGVDAPEHM